MAIVAELKGKLRGYERAKVRYSDAEDPLTASIFESIEVMDRQLGLGDVLRQATGDEFSPGDLAAAKFEYWLQDPEAFRDKTQPDLIITVGDYLYLLEVKYLSGFGQETKKKKRQLRREFEGGMALAGKSGVSRVRMICVGGDMSTWDEVSQFGRDTGYEFHRLQWQDIHRIMADILKDSDLDPRDRILAQRCKALLERRRMGSFDGFRHLEAYKGGQGFYWEVFSFATTLLHRLEPEGIIGAVHEFRIERDGGQRSLKARMVDQWGPSYFALPVQTREDHCVKGPPKGSGGSRRYRVDRFAFFLVDVGTATVMVGKVTAPPDSWKGARFWDVFFRDLKRSWSGEKRDVLETHGTQFEVEVTSIPADKPRVLDKVHKALVAYLG